MEVDLFYFTDIVFDCHWHQSHRLAISLRNGCIGGLLRGFCMGDFFIVTGEETYVEASGVATGYIKRFNKRQSLLF